STSCGTCTPTITCPANVSVVGTPGSSTVIVNYPPPTVGGGCSGVTVVCTPASGSAFPVGTTTVTCTATAGSISASCTFTVSASDVCLQDDTNPATVLVFNSTTGAYTFCCGGVTYTGTGKVTKSGGIIVLDHNPSDRRGHATIDSATHTGSASLQSPPGKQRSTVTDRNTLNNTCTCS